MKNYSIGLDIGTNSVGWAVMTEDYKIPVKRMPIRLNHYQKHTDKLLAGVLLFEDGQTAKERRVKRTTRRRYSRRRYRLMLLQDIFKNEMDKIDESFFHRLQETFLVKDEKNYSKHPIFSNLADEVAYHKNYPTIYHLRKHLADSDEKADLRLIYLAIAHMIKFRGHFLNEGKLEAQADSIQELFNQFIEEYNILFEASIPTQDVEEILTAKWSKTAKKDAILKLYVTEKKSAFAEFIKLIVGTTSNFKKIFDLEEDKKLQFAEEKYIDEVAELLAIIGSEYEMVFEAAKRVYDAMILSDILTVTSETNAPLSASMAKRYDDHKAELQQLKEIVIQHKPELYNEVFRDKTKNGYAGYIARKTKSQEFYKYIEKILTDILGVEDILDKIQREDFLKKQRSFENGQIPHQLHLQELQAIISKQSQHYPFLANNLWKIERLLTFRIPYYVGPLDRKQNSQFAWATFKSNEPVTPFNFEEVVDKEQSAINFIERMTVRDTYLPTEKVLPKHSLLYEKFMVLNELTKVKYVDERQKEHYFDVELKKSIIENLFKKKRKISKKDILKFLENGHEELHAVDIRGLGDETGNFNASYGTYHDLKKILGISFLDDENNGTILEEIIYTLTIFEDKEMILKRLKPYTLQLSEKQIKELSRRHYTGWGRFSSTLINGIRDKKTNKTILEYLEDDNLLNRNFMQLISDPDLSFAQKIEDARSKFLPTNLNEIVEDIHGNPAIKKGILQSLKIVDEIVRVMRHNPTDIVIEMARENQTTKQGRSASQERIKKLEKGLKELQSQILADKKITNKDLQNKKVFLYCMQNGKDMYTDDSLDFNNLQYYDIDHIIPQAFIKDDSFDNCVLTSSKSNRGKSDNVPDIKVVRNKKSDWEILKNAELISQRKWDNLTKAERGGLSLDDKSRFIKRQLVETRQITKHVARILDQRFNVEYDDNNKIIRNVNIITLKSSLTSQFRKTFKLYKVRDLNDFHHAHDAYLSVVVAKTLISKYPKLKSEFVYGEFNKINVVKSMLDKATQKVKFYHNIMKFFENDGAHTNDDGEIIWFKRDHIKQIKNVLQDNRFNVVKKTEFQSGSLTKETVQPKSNKKLIRRKREWETTKYGGYNEPTEAYTVLVVGEVEKKNKWRVVKNFEGITLLEKNDFEKNPVQFLEKKGYRNIQTHLLKRLPKYSLLVLNDGLKRLMASSSELQKGNQFQLPNKLVEVLYYAQKAQDSDNLDAIAYLEDHRDKLYKILDYVQNYAEFIEEQGNMAKVVTIFEQNKEADTVEIAKAVLNLLALTSFGTAKEFKVFDVAIGRKRPSLSGKYLDGTLVYQSITGLYETHVDLGEI